MRDKQRGGEGQLPYSLYLFVLAAGWAGPDCIANLDLTQYCLTCSRVIKVNGCNNKSITSSAE